MPGIRPGTILGVRPEHLEVSDTGWNLHVDTVELLGAERLVYARLGDEHLIVRMDEGRPSPAPGSSLTVTARPERLHAFDAATGKRL